MSQLSLLETPGPGWSIFDLPDADVRLLHGFLGDEEADAMFAALRTSVAWRQDKIKFYGKEHLLPRLQAKYPSISLRSASMRWSAARR